MVWAAAAIVAAALTFVAVPAGAHTVTCSLAANYRVNNVSLDGLGLSRTACQQSWQTPCVYTFTDISRSQEQIVAVATDGQTGTTTTNYCLSSAFGLTCSSTDPASGWNSVRSDQTTWKSVSIHSRRTDNWISLAFNDAVWSTPTASLVSSALFNCNLCGGGTGANGAGESALAVWGCVKQASKR